MSKKEMSKRGSLKAVSFSICILLMFVNVLPTPFSLAAGPVSNTNNNSNGSGIRPAPVVPPVQQRPPLQQGQQPPASGMIRPTIAPVPPLPRPTTLGTATLLTPVSPTQPPTPMTQQIQNPVPGPVQPVNLSQLQPLNQNSPLPERPPQGQVQPQPNSQQSRSERRIKDFVCKQSSSRNISCDDLHGMVGTGNNPDSAIKDALGSHVSNVITRCTAGRGGFSCTAHYVEQTNGQNQDQSGQSQNSVTTPKTVCVLSKPPACHKYGTASNDRNSFLNNQSIFKRYSQARLEKDARTLSQYFGSSVSASDVVGDTGNVVFLDI